MKKILAIDDQKDNLITINAVINSHISDCNVITALSGKEGIEMAIAEQPDVILLDNIMPGLDGFEVCEKLKANPKTKHIPIIMVTAIKTDSENRVKGFNSGADAFLSKPIDGVELAAQINVMLRIKEAEDNLRKEKENLEELVVKRTQELSNKNRGLQKEINERKLAQKEILKIGSHFQAIIEKAPDGIVLLDEKANFKYISPSAKRIFGFSGSAEITGDPALLTHPDDLPMVLTHVDKLLEDPTLTPQLQLRISDAEGTWRWIECTLSNFIKEPSVKAIVVNFHEITEQKKAREALKESEQKLRLMIENSPIGVSTTDLEGHFIEVNAALCKIVGFSKEDMLGFHYNKFSHPDDKLKNLNLFSELVNGKISFYDLEKRYIHKNGEIVHGRIRAQLIRDENGNPLFQTAIIEDITERKETKEMLVKQEARIRSIFRSAPVGIGVVVDRVIKQVNNYLCEITGYSPNELNNQSSRYLYPSQEEFERVGILKYRDIKKRGSGTIETQFKRKDGQIIEVLLSSTPINEKDLSIGVTFTALDITKRKQAEKALRNNEHKLRNIFENSTSLFYTHTCDNVLTDVSPQVNSILGYTQEEAMINWTNFVSDNPMNKAGILNTQKAIKTGTRQPQYELELIKKDGTKIWVEVREFPLVENGKTTAIVGSLVEITERKRAEQIQKVIYNISQAAISTKNIEELIGIVQEQMSTIIDTKNFYIAFYDDKTDSFNSPIISDEKDDISSWPAGKSLSSYVVKRRKPLLAKKEDILKMKATGEVELVGVLSEVWLGVPLISEGVAKGIYAVQSYTNENAYSVKDLEILEFVASQISTLLERKNAEQNLVIALKKANESDRLKSAFLATMSHELRTPLNAIIGFSEFLKESLPESDVKNFGEIINSSGNHLLSIVNDLFDITLIESGETVLRKDNVNLKSLFNDVKNIIDSKLQRDNKSDVGFNIILPEEIDDFQLKIDSNKLKQILINLLKNAFKFTEKGSVSLGLEFDRIHDKPMLKIGVSDTGIGIAKEKQDIIFDIFRQVEDTDSRKYGGTGIGLSVAKRLTEIMGGKIWIESEIGKGSSFFVSIPYDEVQSVQPQTESKASKKMDKNVKTVVVAEDDLPSFLFIKVVLERMGVNILWAKNGEEAVSMCKENENIRLVLMDINMPVLDGYEATKKIKSFRPTLPVIAQTAYAVSGDSEKSIEAGCDDYISKPITQVVLLEKINKYLCDDSNL